MEEEDKTRLAIQKKWQGDKVRMQYTRLAQEFMRTKRCSHMSGTQVDSKNKAR